MRMLEEQRGSGVWKFVATFLAGVVMALAGAWASGVRAQASDHANFSMEIAQLVKSQQDEEQELKMVTNLGFNNQQNIAVLTQKVNDLLPKHHQ